MLRLLQQQQVIDQELYDMLSARPLAYSRAAGYLSAAGVYADGAP